MDYYDIIGVNRNASQDEIKSSYRKKSLLCHPDRPSGSQEKFLTDLLEDKYYILEDYYNEIIFTIALQKLAYELSIAKNINPDKPRNLAKVVTVE